LRLTEIDHVADALEDGDDGSAGRGEEEIVVADYGE
jgi:hypothetical protein